MVTVRDTDLPDLLISLGYQVKRIGRYYTTQEMDSIRIKDRRTWFRYSEGIGGDAITFLQRFYNKSFPEAVEYLLTWHGRARDSPPVSTPRQTKEKEEKVPFTLPPANVDHRRVFAYAAYVSILKEELIPAMGCTEPIALAYAAAKAAQVLGTAPDRVVVDASGSIIKNVKSVIVPNTNHLKGIPAAVAAGIVAGKPEKQLEVISSVTPADIEAIKRFLETREIEVRHVDNGFTFEIIVTLYHGDSYAKVRIVNYHTNIVLIEKDGQILYQTKVEGESEEGLTDHSLLNMADIWDFINTVDVEDIKETLDRQIDYNWAIAQAGIQGDYGANIGKVLLSMDQSVATRAKAMAAAGSDARMSGCELPVVINSGSGNQGITVSVPVIVYAKERNVSRETLYRALALSNLTAIYQKTPIGRLSAYCGAVSAGAGAGAGIAYLCGGGFQEVAHTVVNALAIVSGIVCDGAKPSCVGKIAAAVDAGILGYQMYLKGQQFYSGDGIVTKGVDAMIQNVGRLGKEGMKETNEEIIKMMIGC